MSAALHATGLREAAAACRRSQPRRVSHTGAPRVASRSAAGRCGAAASPLSRRGVLSSGVGLSLATMAASRPSSAAAANNPSAADILKKPDWPEKWPFGPAELARYDEAPDTEFYSAPRFVTHIDDAAINALTAYYAKAFPASGRSDTALLDICSSWISHYPAGYTAGRISGLGMNEAELKRNSILNDYVVADLNATPKLPYPDNTFDVVTNAVSVDYLTKPLQVMQEVQRVLKPGGLALMSFSNRCFPTKAIAIWTSTGDLDHIWIVGAYMHFAGGFEPPEAVDISPNKGRSDPMYVVIGKKAAAATTA